MRTTIEIDDDLMVSARAKAAHQGRTLGQIVSDGLRRGFEEERVEFVIENGIKVVPRKPGVVVTLEMVNAMRDDEP